MPYGNVPDDPSNDPRYQRQYRVGEEVEVNVGSYHGVAGGNDWRRGVITQVFYGAGGPSGRAPFLDRIPGLNEDWDDHWCEVRLRDGSLDSWRVHSLRYSGESHVDWGH
jgi:hypothetical protein